MERSQPAMGKIIIILAMALLIFALFGRDTVMYETVIALKNGRIINNEIMSAQYPSSFRPGTPPYLERDFEAGADFICDAIEKKYGKYFCGRDGINWR
jgi:hypothetical protein